IIPPTATTDIETLSLHDALPIWSGDELDGTFGVEAGLLDDILSGATEDHLERGASVRLDPAAGVGAKQHLALSLVPPALGAVGIVVVEDRLRGVAASRRVGDVHLVAIGRVAVAADGGDVVVAGNDRARDGVEGPLQRGREVGLLCHVEMAEG